MADPLPPDLRTLSGWLLTEVAELEAVGAEIPPPLPKLTLDRNGSDPEADLRLGATLGVGGMAVVTRAEQTALGRDVAVKRSKDPGHAQKTRALLREAWITGQLDHPNVVPVHLVGETVEGEPIVVLRAIGGQAWSVRVVTDPATHPDALARHLAIFVAVCNAAHFAHERGFLHRDIKPDNVQLGAFGEVYLLDWGIAEPMSSDELGPAGTPAYVAPESLENGPPDRRSDVFLLAATLLHAVTGAPPRGQLASEQVIKGVRAGVPVEVPESVPAGLRRILQRALATDPARRHATAIELRDDVLGWQVAAAVESLLSAAGAHCDACAESVAAALADPDDDAAPQEARARFAAARFGYEQVLADRPADREAQRGLGALLEALLPLELADRHEAAARALLAAHPDPPASMEAAIDEAVRAWAAEGAEQERLAALARSFDARDIAGDYVWSVVVVSLATLIGILVANVGFGWRGGDDGVRIVITLLPSAVALAGACWWKRRTLLAHPVGRKLMGSAAGLVAVMLIGRVMGAVMGVAADTLMSIEPLMVAAWLFGYVAYQRAVLPVALYVLAGSVVVLLLPDGPAAIVAHNGLVLSSLAWVAWIWGRMLRRGADPT